MIRPPPLPNDNLFLCGPTGCGKSTLARKIAARDMARGLPVLVCSPKPDPWPCTWQTQDVQAIHARATRLPSATLILDDAQTLLGKNAGALLSLANAIRADRPHFRRSIFTVQDPFDLDRQIRLNCATFFLWFTSDTYARQQWERQCAVPGLAAMLAALPLYHYLKIEVGPMGGQVKHFRP